ncbi:hypothetical protein AB0M68_21125 [Streptomyces sp. NPDC051453]|uniref:hypothetical protein n=1 Tax=Streptomyces sp. NPDC051453 TaxID=3154941 RepID=UPI00341C39EA
MKTWLGREPPVLGWTATGFRRREAQVQTMMGRRLPWAATEFTGLLVSLLDPPKPLS